MCQLFPEGPEDRLDTFTGRMNGDDQNKGAEPRQSSQPRATP